MTLQKLRRHIDRIDEKLITLLNNRLAISARISRVKRQSGKSTYSPEREREILKKIVLLNKGPLPNKALEAIYREIMSASLVLGTPLKIAYLGPEATFSHLAALKRFGSQLEYLACENIDEVFLEVEKGNADYGVVPIENSIEGAVNYTLDMFVDSDLKIYSQIIYYIAHNLLSESPLDRIKHVYSHPHVFGQCRVWLQENLKHADKIEVSSTTHAAQIAATHKNSAAIASLLAAKLYKLQVRAKNIEDCPHNATRFLVIGKSDVPRTGNDRTSLLFSIKDRVGALYDILHAFKQNRINLTKIESRPSKRKAWDYYFFVDLEGHRDDTQVKKALKELEHHCTFVKILGSYPIGE